MQMDCSANLHMNLPTSASPPHVSPALTLIRDSSCAMRFEDLPPELLAHICLLAMAGDSQAATSLQLASHTLCAAASIHRFHSIFVAGLEAVQLLMGTLDQASNGAPQIKHLFICDQSARHADNFDRLFRPRRGRSITTDPVKYAAEIELRIAKANEAHSIIPLISRLLEIAGPTVQSLTLMFFHSTVTGVMSLFKTTPFPHMHALSVRFPSWTDEPKEDEEEPELRIPALQRLKFSISTIRPNICMALERIARASPLLITVKIEGAEATSSLTDYINRIIAARKTLDTGPEPWALLGYSIYPVRPSPMGLGKMRIFSAEVQRISDLGLSGLEVHRTADRAPGFLQWSHEWKKMVAEEVFPTMWGRL